MRENVLFLMTDARHFGVTYQINPWMQPDAWQAGRPSLEAAAMQSAAGLAAALGNIGAKVETMPAVADLPDLVFPANAATILDGRVLLARFRHPERQGEEEVFRAAFLGLQARGLIEDVIDLPDGVLQEGAGDCIWDQDRGLFWAGYGQRSSVNSLPAIADTFGQPVIGLELATDRFYHLDTCFCPLSGGRLLYYPPAFTPEALATIHAHVKPQDRLVATNEDAAAFCVNAVNVGRHIVMAKAPAALRKRLTALGYSVNEVDLSPFILSGGGAYCMTLRLDRTSRPGAMSLAAE
ncbi:MAG TPA: arginine deiminase-related protein [Rhizomicrobium sp.]|jgi:N-dimethylarginine dimethylaminohydrolase